MCWIGCLHVSRRILYRITAWVSHCVLGCALSHLCDRCRPVGLSDAASRRVIGSATKGKILVPLAPLVIVQRRAFSIVDTSIWNDLPLELQFSNFYKSLKSFILERFWVVS